LPEIDQEERFLKEALGATPVEPTDRAVRDLLRNGGFDIFHFAGHGLAKPDSFQQAAIQIGDVEVGGRFDEITLSANTVESNADLNADGTGGPLVFLNACQVGKAGLQLGSMGGFAQAFLRSGAAAFVSTLWSVGDAPARTFGETFYKQLLQGNSVAEAVTRAREEARQSGDVSWLAYVVYANPSARMQPP
jgi:CHAT domain-containing protein